MAMSTSSGVALCEGRIIVGMDTLGRPSIALRDKDGTVGAHFSLGDTLDFEARLEPGGPLVDCSALLRLMAAIVKRGEEAGG